MTQQMGEVWAKLLAFFSNPATLVWGFVASVALLSAAFLWLCCRHWTILWTGLLMCLRVPIKARRNYLTWVARRELRMRRARLMALKERAASALTAWLLYEVQTNGMTLEESYDMQMMLARNLCYPDLQPKYEPDNVKSRIKARRAQGHRPVKLPDMDRRGKLKLITRG